MNEPPAPDQSADSKRELLQQLKLDRGAQPQNSGGAMKWLGIAGALVGVAIGLWYLQSPSSTAAAVPAEVVTPDPASVATTAANQPATQASRPQEPRKVDSVLDATGYVVARRQATVSSKATGKVVEVRIEEGLLVEEGQLLARLDDSIPRAQLALAEAQLASATAGLEELKVQIKQAKLDLGRTTDLAQRKLASQADLDRDGLSVEALVARLERAQRDVNVAEMAGAVQAQLLADMEIRAPFTGVVIAKAAQPGEMISPVSAGGGFTRTGICTIVDMASLEIEVDVNESYINRVFAGQPVSATLNAYPDTDFAAEVIAIIPAADRNKATVRVRIRLLDGDERVLPDMGVRVAFLDDRADDESA